MKIDVHAHVFPAAYLDLLDEAGGAECGTAAARGLRADSTGEDLALRIAMMDSAGVNLQILSVTPQSPHLRDAARATEAARVINDAYAEIVRKGRGRFAAFAALPLPHVGESIRELRRALDDLGMLGVAVTTAIQGMPLASAAFDDLFAELNRRESILFVHPVGTAAGAPAIAAANLTWPLGAPVEDTLCFLQLLQARVPERFPRIKFIVAHLGGCLPLLPKRLDVQAPWFMPAGSHLPSNSIRSFWFDTVGGHPPALRCACETIGADRLLLGSDVPYWQGELYQWAVAYVAQSGLPSEDVVSIYGANAQRLFGRALTMMDTAV